MSMVAWTAQRLTLITIIMIASFTTSLALLSCGMLFLPVLENKTIRFQLLKSSYP